MLGHAMPAFGGVRRLKAGGEWPGSAGPAQSQGLCALEKRLNRPAQLRPEFDLACDGALGDFSREPRIEEEFVRDLDWLTHTGTVA